ncbi:uncharacterized protein SPAPADRAFT_144654 [Spathaspora passalidarum NRRL Y-27907]|uniref:PHD-type domain-containing protein n=1 Tax=Spathaspora passalidarum (strain NRRL Y-27907 / 11-Y1) TaxID=619300 RepID=G3AVF1_SPAPN|nr:uncharacterized protein SPAPADRAFT_144654 [Spathaspora passalidarum NRRL Y-27907]EGW30170.1 hypothetical protein SPAPADRAFT_144654 [Spathaspora passalidarum NRRL Y-27907]
MPTVPQLKPSPDIKENGNDTTSQEAVSGIVYRNGKKVFIEPTLAEPTPIYTGLSLESYPSAKIKKESQWPKFKRNKSSTTSRESSVAPEQEVDSEVERIYKEKLATKLAEDLTEESQIRDSDKRVLPMRTAKLKLTLKTPKTKGKRPASSSSPVRSSKRIKVISPKKSSTNLSVPNLPATSSDPAAANEETKDNDDFCSSCGNPGIFICCENCPKSFHFTCCDPPIEQPPEDDWFCRECIAKLHPEKIKTYNDIGVFGQLLNQLEVKNPKVFQLPKHLREDTFIGVTTGDNGDYSDDTTKPDVPSSKNSQDVDIESSLYDKAGNPYLCHKCGESGMNNRTLMHCDYCPLIYHIDCLNDPICGPKTIGNKWRCPNHIEDLLPPGYAKLRQFKDCQVVDSSLHKSFLKMAAMSNILIKLEDQPYLKQEVAPPNLEEYLQFQQEDFNNKILKNWGDDMDAIHPQYQVPSYFQKTIATPEGVTAKTSSKLAKMFTLTKPGTSSSFIYRVPEKSIVLDFISKTKKQDIIENVSQYTAQSRLETNPEELELVENLNQLKSINFTELLKAVDIASEDVDTELSLKEIKELRSIKKLMEAKGEEALMKFLQS